MKYLFIGGSEHGLYRDGTGDSEMKVVSPYGEDDEFEDQFYNLREDVYVIDGMLMEEVKPLIKKFRDHLPICCICNKAVDGISTKRLTAMCATQYLIHCHGEVEIITLIDDDVINGVNIDFSKAFDKKVKVR